MQVDCVLLPRYKSVRKKQNKKIIGLKRLYKSLKKKNRLKLIFYEICWCEDYFRKYLRSLLELSDEQVVHNTHISF